MTHEPEVPVDPRELEDFLRSAVLEVIGDSWFGAKHELEARLLQLRRRALMLPFARRVLLSATVVAIPWPHGTTGLKLTAALAFLAAAATRSGMLTRPVLVWGARDLTRPKLSASKDVPPDAIAAAIMEENQQQATPLALRVIEYWLIYRQNVIGVVVGVAYGNSVAILGQRLLPLHRHWPYNSDELGILPND